MEEWQKEYIDTILCRLEKETICSDELLQQLLSDGALAEVDLETIRCKSIPSEKAQTLYDMMKTRTDGYVAMMKALVDCYQPAAHQILLQGYAYCLSRNTPINFLGKTKRLSEYFDDMEIQELIASAKLKLSEKPLNKSYAYPKGKDDEITLVRNPEPPLPPLYIPRKLFKRFVINKRLFQAESSDVFVFKGFHTLGQLQALVHPHRSALSSSYLAQDTMTARFILLEHDDHWERIMNITNVPTHLVKYEEDTSIYILEATTGRSKIIGQHLERPQESIAEGSAHKLLSEDDFIDGILDGPETDKGVCICDSPGMGKTFLLANLAHKIIERCPEKLVAFISLSHFMQQLTSNGISLEVSTAYARNAILENLCTSPLSFCILDRILQKFQVPIDLLLDGFDEVNSKHMEFTKQLLGELVASFQNARVIVTSRPNLRIELETTLGVIAYDIVEFTEAMQIEFLVNYWGDKRKEFDCVRLAKFARYCLESLSGSLSREERTVTGIPLLCRLFAEVYSRKAKRCARAAGNAVTQAGDICRFETSLPNLYAKYIKGSFEKNTKSDLILKVKQYHIWKALQSLFPEFESEYRTKFSVKTSQDVVESAVYVGLLENRVNGNRETVEFIHRTFSEYFVAEFIAKTLTKLQESAGCSEDYNNNFIRFLFEVVLVTEDVGNTDDVVGNIFIHSDVAYFLNYFTEIGCPPTTFQILAQRFSISISPTRLYSMLFGCLRGNYENVFRIIKSILVSLNTEALSCYKDFMIPDGDRQLVIWLINVASVSSSITLVDALFAMFRDCFSYSLETVCNEMPLHLDTPLHFAIERADVEKIQYFAKVMSLKNRKLLLSSVIRSNDDSSQTVKRKAEMCRLLLSMDKELLSEASYTLYDSVHVEILKVLIASGADTLATKSHETVVHFGAKYMSADDFHELCRFLILDIKAEYLFKSSKLFWSNILLDAQRQGPGKIIAINRRLLCKWKCPLHYILSREMGVAAQTIEMILGIPDIYVNEKDKKGNTPFLLAVLKGQDEKVITLLAQNGAAINALNDNKQNALHLAAAVANTKIVPFLMDLGVDCRHTDLEGNSFLHYFRFKGAMAEEYHNIIDLLSFSGKSDVFHMKNKDGALPVHIAVKHLNVKRETLQIFKNHKVNFNSVYKDNNSLLFCATLGGRSVHLLTALIEMGVDVMLETSYGCTFAHLMSEAYTAEQCHQLISFLLSNGYENAILVPNNEGITPLHRAVYNVELLPETLELIHTKLIKCNKWSINAGDISNITVLMYAVKGVRSVACIKALLDMGADAMIQSKDGKTMAHMIESYSAEEYHTITEILIESGHAQVFKVEDNDGWTPFHWAVGKMVLLPKTLHLVNAKLVQTGIVNMNTTNKNGSGILVSAVVGQAPFVKINRDAPIPRMDPTKQDSNLLVQRSIGVFGSHNVPTGNWSARHLRILAEMGADVSIRELCGNTFLHFIPYVYSVEEYHDILKFLVETGQEAVFKIENIKGISPLRIAIEGLELLPETLNLLNSALFQTSIMDINVVDKDGKSLLFFAAEGKRSVKFLENLMEMNADVTTKNMNGNTFAHVISQYYSPNEYHDIVKLLFRKGQERAFQIVNMQGQTPLHLAVHHLELLDDTLNLFNSALFRTGIVDINSCDFNGYTFLSYAVHGKRSVKCLENLLKMGVDVMICDNNGNAFTHVIPEYCTPSEYHDILVLLISTDQARSLTVKNIDGMRPLHFGVYRLELLPETLDLFAAVFMSLNNEALCRSTNGMYPMELDAVNNNGDTVLHFAIKGGRSLQLVEHLAALGANCSVKNKHNNSLAHLSASSGLVEHLKYFVEHGCDVNALNNDGDSVLHCAVHDADKNIYEMVTYLLENGANKHYKNKIQQTAYDYAIEKSITDVRILNTLSTVWLESSLEPGCEIMKQDENGNTIAHLMSTKYSPHQYHKILEHFVLTRQETIFQVKNKKGQTPLHIAILRLELLEATLDLMNSALIKKNVVDINATDSAGNSLLVYAAWGKRSVKFLQNLMKMNVDPGKQNADGDTFVHLIPSYYTADKYHNIVDFLIEEGQSNTLLVENSHGDSPLHHAVYNLEILPETLNLFASLFLSLDNDIHEGHLEVQSAQGLNAINKDGEAILHWALRGKRSLQFVENLVNYGADCLVKCNHGSSLAHLSASFGLVEFLKYFVGLGCDVNALDNDGDSVLHCAVEDASENVYEMVTFLLENGANKYHSNNAEKTAYACAIEKGISDHMVLDTLK